MNKYDKEMWELLRTDIKELKERVTILEDVFNQAKGVLWFVSKLAALSSLVAAFLFGLGKLWASIKSGG